MVRIAYQVYVDVLFCQLRAPQAMGEGRWNATTLRRHARRSSRCWFEKLSFTCCDSRCCVMCFSTCLWCVSEFTVALKCTGSSTAVQLYMWYSLIN
jgi:hypothetical protein